MITGLHHYALEVPDLEVADTFLQGFGLETAEQAEALVGRCPGRAQEQVRMVEGVVKQLHHVAFSVHPGTIDAVRERLERAGVAEIDPIPGAPDGGVWVRDPHGVAVQLLEVEQSPARPVAEVLTNIGAVHHRFDVSAALGGDHDVMPRRLGHTLLFTPDQAASTAFYVDVLGFAISDRITGKVTFLNAGPGDHHVFGFITSTHSGFHHASYEVPSIDAIGLGAQRMRSTGYTKGWGVGRHTVGSNFFHYTQDPWGSWIEWFSDIDQIQDCWVARDWDLPPHLWGSPPPEDFLLNREPTT